MYISVGAVYYVSERDEPVCVRIRDRRIPKKRNGGGKNRENDYAISSDVQRAWNLCEGNIDSVRGSKLSTLLG